MQPVADADMLCAALFLQALAGNCFECKRSGHPAQLWPGCDGARLPGCSCRKLTAELTEVAATRDQHTCILGLTACGCTAQQSMSLGIDLLQVMIKALSMGVQIFTPLALIGCAICE